ncbi:MAG: isoleucine--tRNA ligase [bacterium]
MFNTVDKKPVFPRMEEKILQKWRENRIFEKCVELRRGNRRFLFYEGPPTANGMPHPGHVLTRVMKDVFLRHRTMRGYDVLRKGGWDTHGLPVELEVEKELGLNGKDQIEEYGVAGFVKKCRESVFRYESEWRKMTERVACWLDMENPYVTCANEYIESVWWILKQYWERGALYKGHKIVPYCPRCGTALSSHEVAQGYEETDDPSVVIRCPVAGEPGTSFLVWTTTPWTLISNVALAVGEDIDYVKVRRGGEVFILAEARVPAVFGCENPEIVERLPGARLKGTSYERPFAFCSSEKKGWYVITADFVSLDEGTGIVHIAPAFGEDDFRAGGEYDLPFFQPVDEKGRFTDEVTEWKGTFVKDADASIIEDLEHRGLLFRHETYRHSYPFCWRCDSPLLYYARSSWFLKTTAYRDDLLRVNEEIRWVPDHIRRGRMGDFLENNVDWAISRDRYWGTPLPLWVCEDCGETECFDSAGALRERADDFPEGGLDLHKPGIDEVRCRCAKCGGVMNRAPEVIDCWFDSGAMPLAQWHYPHENRELFGELFPADFITEAVDQTRGWFYSLMAISTFLFNKSSFRNCLVLGHVVDGEGQKMSKSRDNVIDPWLAFNDFGADSFRWYFFRENNPWIPTRFFMDALSEVQKNFFLTLWNVYSFFVIYANIDGFDPVKHPMKTGDLSLIDRWMLSRLNGLVRSVDENLADFQVTPAAREIEAFVNDLSNWYVRRSRNRFWKAEKDSDKRAAYATLYTALTTLSRLLAPFIPFISDELHGNLVRSHDRDAPESVHMTDFPACDETLIDPSLDATMEKVREIVNEGRSLRAGARIRIRQPIALIAVKVPEGRTRDAIAPFIPLILEELNTKEAVILDSLEEFTVTKIKPNFKRLGPKFGKNASKIAALLSETDPSAILRQLDSTGKADVRLDGETVTIEKDDLETERAAAEGFAAGELTAIDTRITDDLRRAGVARELVHRIQNARRELDLDYTDRIVIRVLGEEDVLAVIEEYVDYIKTETLAIEIRRDLQPGEGEECRIDAGACRLKLEKAPRTGNEPQSHKG